MPTDTSAPALLPPNPTLGLTDAQIRTLLQNLHRFSEPEAREIERMVDELTERRTLQAARMDLIEFCRYMQPDYKVGRHHRILADLLMAIERGDKDRICVSLPPRHGKQLAHETLVPTPSGYRRHGDLRPGDYVFGPDGHPVRVLAIGPEAMQDVEVEFTNGEVVRCHEAHEWAVYDRRKGRGSPSQVVETRDLEADVWIGNAGRRGGRARWQLPDVEALEYPEKVQPLHPYALGVWLGDGSTTKPAITGVDEEVFAAFAQATGYTETMRVVHATTGVVTVAYAGPRPNVRGQLSAALFELGLLGPNHTGKKRIPPQYKYASRLQRLQLLAGLMDTDGHVEATTGRCRIVIAFPELAEDVRELVTGLGFRGYVMAQQPTLSSSGIQGRKVVYTVGFQPTEPLPTVLPRKQVCRFAVRRRIAVKSVRRVEPHLGRCIQVDREDGLYLVGKTHVPTHNSQLVSLYFAAWFMGRNPTKKLMLVSHTTDLAVDFGRKVRNIIADPQYKKLFPDTILSSDSKSAGRWNTTMGGEFYAAGVGSSIAGRGADLLVVDDPHSEQDILNGNYSTFEKAYEWFTFGARTRLMPGGRVAIVHCMVGNTRVLMADGTEKVLREVCPGDMVASYDHGTLVARKVLNWANQGPDRVYTLAMHNGNLVRANARHPFLVAKGDRVAWVRLRDLRPGDALVSLTAASGPFSTSEIISITPDGIEDVFDIQVEGTENFIANGVVSHNTRWSSDDLIGRVIRDMTQRDGADQYEVVEFPAILEVEEPDPDAEPDEDGEQPTRVVQKPLWPEFFDLQALLRTKASMPAFQWNAQYQQNPTAEGAALVKREWWREWEKDEPPDCEYVIMSLDTASETNSRADFTAMTVWGVFLNEEEDNHQIILLNADKRRLEFPELKVMALEAYKEWEPDAFIVEKKNSGVALYQELRRTGMPVQEYTPHRGSGDKFARLNAVSDIIRSGLVWVPRKRWAEELVEEIAGFPAMPHDDLVDATVIALMRFRQGGFIRLPSDDIDDDDFLYRPPAAYY